MSIWLTVKLAPGTNIPARGIPDLIDLANKLGVSVHCKANDVLIMAGPGDDPIDLAVAWEREMSNDRPHKIAVAWSGREHRVRTSAQLSQEGQDVT